ncbi:uncharacterized protein [Cicer arietinum]|uniref:Uncharacterized protein LOC105851045 n=1 Tax=Cicer arietinum TaxID=3827 RepID=A0A1S2XWH3_CICAR|nr:uncharacterized protein LOC105851045 [Cicer arietinum]
MHLHRIDQEMSKAKKSKHNPPNVVAKLMGLETLPVGESNSQNMYDHLGWPLKHWQLENRLKMMNRDGYETWLQFERACNMKEDVDEGKMALIRQKFVEAKHLSTNERLRQSKQFENALDVLSSNNDLLVRFLDSQKPYQPPSTPPDDAKRITLIKPLKMFGNDNSSEKGKKNDRLLKKQANSDQESQKFDEFSVQSTRIVVLKPSPGRTHDLKDFVSPTNPSPQSFYQRTRDDNVIESIKVAKEITLEMHEGLKSYQKDKTLHSSVFSSGYSSNESSFNKSYHEFAEGNLSNLEALSSMGRHSWDCINVCGSPYSTQSLGRASCFPESSSVCIEAKKRLSERWNMITSNDKGHQEQRYEKRNSTLGEMLSLSLVKKSVTSSEVESTDKDQEEPCKYISCSQSFNDEMMSVDVSTQNVSGSNSFVDSRRCRDRNIVPAPSTFYELCLSVDADIENGSKVLEKSKSNKRSSFKGKVASFLFSMSKKSTKKKSSSSQSKDESETTVAKTSVPSVNSPRVLGDNVSQIFNVGGFEEYLAAQCESSGTTDSVSSGQQEDMITLEPGLPESNPLGPEISNEKQDRPSPISVLESPFENYNTAQESLECMQGGHMGSLVSLKSNLIDKSPPIESVARTLSWDDDSCGELATPYYPSKPIRATSLDNKLEENEWLLLVQKLLSASGLDNQQHYDSFHTRWHSFESPLDPSLRDTYANINEKDTQPLNEAKRRKIRSNQKLVFDCVNDAILEVVGYGPDNYFKKMCSGTHNRPLVQEGSCLVDHIVTQMKELIIANNGMRFVLEECGGDSHSLVVENVVRKEVVQLGLVEVTRMEIDVLGREIEGMIIEEIVEDAVFDFNGK